MKTEQKDNRISSVVDTALKNLKNMADVNTVIGAPVKTQDNDIIIPVSKVTVGVLSGGGEYGKLNIFKSGEDLPFSAGNGAIISLKPCGFLIKDANNEFKVLNISGNNYEAMFDKITNYLGELKNDNSTN